MNGDRPADDNFIADHRSCALDGHLVRNNAYARSIDENFVRLAAIDYLRGACDEFDAGVISRSMHRLHDAPEILHRQTLFENKTGREIKRARAAHRQVVNGPVNSEFADV